MGKQSKPKPVSKPSNGQRGNILDPAPPPRGKKGTSGSN